jgi:outer membrane lipoprotein carrier protein
MIIMKNLVFGLIILLSFQSALADETAVARERLITLLEQSDNLVADFEQKTFKELAANPEISIGLLKIAKPLKFNWYVKSPFEQQVISDGETLWVYDPDLEQATYQPISNNLQHSPAMILAQPRESLTGHYGVFEANVDELTIFKLYPVDPDSVFSELALIFEGDLISEIRILDSLAQETVISFSNISNSQPIPDETFDFNPPAGTDLFEQM